MRRSRDIHPQYESHTGERPMAVNWRLWEEMPTELYLRAAIGV